MNIGRTKGAKNKKNQHNWTNEEKEYLALIVKGKTTEEILNLMNEKFEYEFSLTQIRSAMNRYKLRNGIDCRFEKSIEPWNKGLKGYIGPNKTSFKKGNIPPNHKEVGTERINSEGYIEVKVSEPNRWKLKHRLIYEKYHGEIPKDHVVIFADGNKMNLDINNLISISRHQLLVLNGNNLIYEDTDLTKTGVNIANLIIKLRDFK